MATVLIKLPLIIRGFIWSGENAGKGYSVECWTPLFFVARKNITTVSQPMKTAYIIEGKESQGKLGNRDSGLGVREFQI
jgi:hypothetical protein